MRRSSSDHRAILLMIASAFSFAVMNLCVRLSGDLPSLQKSFFRNAVAMVFAVIVLLKNRGSFVPQKGCKRYILARSLIGTLGIICNFYAIDHIPLADASILNKMSPFFVILFSIFILSERLDAVQALTVCGAFVGCLFVVKPSFAAADFHASAIGLAGGLCAGLAYTFVRLLGKKGEKGALIVFYFSLISCLTTLPGMLLSFHPMQPLQLLALLGAGLGAAGGQFCITAAYCRAPAREISVYDYSQIIFATTLGAVVLGELPDWLSFVGYAIIIGMAVLLFWHNNRPAKDRKTEKSS